MQDIDSYRNTFKKQIKEWIASVTQRKQEWLVVHVIGQDPRVSGNFLRMKGTVLDRIKSDFNADKRDRWASIYGPSKYLDVASV